MRSRRPAGGLDRLAVDDAGAVALNSTEGAGRGLDPTRLEPRHGSCEWCEKRPRRCYRRAAHQAAPSASTTARCYSPVEHLRLHWRATSRLPSSRARPSARRSPRVRSRSHVKRPHWPCRSSRARAGNVRPPRRSLGAESDTALTTAPDRSRAGTSAAGPHQEGRFVSDTTELTSAVAVPPSVPARDCPAMLLPELRPWPLSSASRHRADAQGRADRGNPGAATPAAATAEPAAAAAPRGPPRADRPATPPPRPRRPPRTRPAASRRRHRPCSREREPGRRGRRRAAARAERTSRADARRGRTDRSERGADRAERTERAAKAAEGAVATAEGQAPAATAATASRRAAARPASPRRDGQGEARPAAHRRERTDSDTNRQDRDRRTRRRARRRPPAEHRRRPGPSQGRTRAPAAAGRPATTLDDHAAATGRTPATATATAGPAERRNRRGNRGAAAATRPPSRRSAEDDVLIPVGGHPGRPGQLRLRADLRLPARPERRLRLAGPGPQVRPAQGRRVTGAVAPAARGRAPREVQRAGPAGHRQRPGARAGSASAPSSAS